MTTIPEQRSPVDFLTEVFETLESQCDNVEHLFIVRSAVHAAQLGVQARALCGVWKFAGFENLDGDYWKGWRDSDVQENDCPDCLVAAELNGIGIAERDA